MEQSKPSLCRCSSELCFVKPLHCFWKHKVCLLRDMAHAQFGVEKTPAYLSITFLYIFASQCLYV
jgi:hypothetical protein